MKNELDGKFIKEDAFENHLFEIDQLKTIEYFAEHSSAIFKELTNNLGTNWT
ncbi:hypothetical protein FACS1894218_5450 [Bacilli bacterium]|nr:hypothetical protein FACS1894218_5450 [Bacilli bacterium]